MDPMNGNGACTPPSFLACVAYVLILSLYLQNFVSSSLYNTLLKSELIYHILNFWLLPGDIKTEYREISWLIVQEFLAYIGACVFHLYLLSKPCLVVSHLFQTCSWSDLQVWLWPNRDDPAKYVP